jgi:hypothetical protein
LSDNFDRAREILARLRVVARSQGPAQLEAVDLLVKIAADTCYEIELLYFDKSLRQLVEAIALKRDFFPATFSNLSGLDGENWPGNILRSRLNLAPQLLGKGRRRKKDVPPEDIAAIDLLRNFIGIFTRAVLNDSNDRDDIPVNVKQRIRSASRRDRLKITVSEFVKWMQLSGRGMVLDDRYGQFHAIAERRRKSMLRSEPKADIWRGFSMVVRDQLRADLRSPEA